MTRADNQQANRVRELVESVRARLEQLPADAVLRNAAPKAWLDKLAEQHPPELPPGYVPPLLLFLHRRTVDDLLAFEADIEQVRHLSSEPSRVATFVPAGRDIEHARVRQWYGGMAELAIQSSLLSHLPAGTVRIEPALPNGKVADAAVSLGARDVWIEVTALTMSDATYAGFDPSPGIQIGYGDPYADARRVYRKTFDKVVGVGQDARSQLHPGEPSVLVISDGDVSMGFGSLGVDWAIAELLHPDERDPSSDASLVQWLRHDYGDARQEAEQMLRNLSAIAPASYGLTGLTLLSNDAADDSHQLSTDELTALAVALQIDRPWTGPPAVI